VTGALRHSPTAETERDPERHTEDILEGIGEAFLALDRHWRILYFNRACEEFFGRPRDEVLGQVVWDVYPQTLGSEFERQYRRVMEVRAPAEFQTESAVRPGRWLEVRAFPTRQGLGAAFRDVSERYRTKEDLRYQLDLTRTITTHTAEALFLLDVEGRVTFVNPAAETMFGFSAAELGGRMLHELIRPQSSDGSSPTQGGLPEHVDDALASLGVQGGVFLRKDQTAISVSCSSTPLLRDQRVIGAALVVRDTTERNRRDAALRESEARFRHMADSAPALIWMTDAAGQITFANMHHDYMFGRPAATMHGTGWNQVVLQEDLDEFEAAFAAAFRDRVPFQMEIRVKDKDSRVRWLRCEGVPRLDDGGNFLGYTTCSVDISDVRVAGERQRLLINELNHRVKNTLATVQSIATQTLRQARSLGQAREDFEARLLALSRVHDVLTRERWEGARLSEIIGGAVAPYRNRETNRFNVNGPELRLSPRMTLALAMALQELVTNAVKYGALSTDAGQVDITWTTSEKEDGPRLVLTWRERGGPAVRAPARRGFGTRLIERSLADDLDGTVAIEFAITGVVCTVDAPLDAVQ
jgi:PAS domain S-box-containing protein